MCGIAGVINFNREPVSPVVLKRMTDAIAHRGPDGEGHYIHENVGLGHRRLAILDLSPKGHQPMTCDSNNYVLIFNGEVYNYRELRLELESLGHAFISETDSEVVLHAYIEWKEACVHRFNGMFAFAIWDNYQKHLFIARDRYGIKPMYYAFIGERFIFASEQKAILTHPDFRKEMDQEALLEYFTFQNIFTDKTFFKNIKLFPAGHSGVLSLSSSEKRIHLKQYWDFNFQEPDQPASEEEYIEELDRLFTQAVRRQLVSDVDIGVYLSGGMDSGSITAIAAKELPYMKSFTCGFDLNSASGLELGFDEREKAEYMSYLFKTEHYEMVLKAGDMERIMPKLAWHIEEPRVGQSYPNFYVAQLASKFVKVVLSGAGGDEIFGGYPWRYYRAANSSGFDDYIDQYYSFWQRLIPNAEVKEVFKPIWGQVKHVWTRDIFRNVLKNCSTELTRPEDYINHSLYLEAKTFLHGLLVVEDKLSSAHGLESRVPFLDNDLVDFATKLPVKMKLRNLTEITRMNENETGNKGEKYFLRSNDGKMIFRKAMQKYIPKEIHQATKQGFSAPDESWFKGESMEFVSKIVRNKNSSIYEYMDYDAVSGLVDEHMEGNVNRRLFIWSLICFEHWSRHYH